jgi:hypothetical protein
VSVGAPAQEAEVQQAEVQQARPASWDAAWAAAEAAGDVRALEATPVPSMDQLCGRNAQGVQGRMFSQGGVMFCRWD